jgi:hypothetical protein
MSSTNWSIPDSSLAMDPSEERFLPGNRAKPISLRRVIHGEGENNLVTLEKPGIANPR